MIKRTAFSAGLTLMVAIAACGSNQASAPSPSPPSPRPPPVFASPSPPAPEQRQEPSLPVPVEETAAGVEGGRLFVIGGFNAAGASLASVYVFDGATWSAGPGLPLPVDHASSATLDGQLYLAGGHSNGGDSARVFRLDGDRWTELAPMHYARGGHALIAVGGKLYAVGGNTARGNVGPVESFDPAADAWTVVTSLPSPRNHVAGFVLGHLACAAGGRYPTTARVDCFDVVAGSWSRLADLPTATSGFGAATFVGGYVVVMGGQDASETRIVPLLTRYNSNDNTWSSGGAMQSPRHGFELAIFQGRAWACGGGSAPGLHPVATCTSVGNLAASERGK